MELHSCSLDTLTVGLVCDPISLMDRILNCQCLWMQSEYPKYTPLLAKILEGVLSRSNVENIISHHKEVICNIFFLSFSFSKVVCVRIASAGTQYERILFFYLSYYVDYIRNHNPMRVLHKYGLS